MKHSNENLKVGVFYRGRLAVKRRRRRSTTYEEQFRTIQIRAKKTPDRRGPERSKVK
jgi:hypothetical protein